MMLPFFPALQSANGKHSGQFELGGVWHSSGSCIACGWGKTKKGEVNVAVQVPDKLLMHGMASCMRVSKSKKILTASALYANSKNPNQSFLQLRLFV